ncbi:MAG: hypothetical protein H6605_03530 [Flavobacteriales bacterium]|nr:hypothetical protein [Flavobacteriales bacterium]
MKKTHLIFAFGFTLLAFLSACNKSSDTPAPSTTDTTKGGGGNGGGGGGGNSETGTNLNPDFSFYFGSTKIVLSKLQADYGAKTYMTGFDLNDNFILDLAMPAAKNVVAGNKTFSIENDQYTGMGLFIDDQDQKWYFEGGTINITKNSANTMSGTFTSKAILLDFTTPSDPQRLDSVEIKSGVFNNIKVKG